MSILSQVRCVILSILSQVRLSQRRIIKLPHKDTHPGLQLQAHKRHQRRANYLNYVDPGLHRFLGAEETPLSGALETPLRGVLVLKDLVSQEDKNTNTRRAGARKPKPETSPSALDVDVDILGFRAESRNPEIPNPKTPKPSPKNVLTVVMACTTRLSTRRERKILGEI